MNDHGAIWQKDQWIGEYRIGSNGTYHMHFFNLPYEESCQSFSSFEAFQAQCPTVIKHGEDIHI